MSEGEGSEQQQRYCTNCGAEIRPGTHFCVFCGVILSSGDASEGTDDALDFEDAPREEPTNDEEPRSNEEAAGSSPQDIYRVYDLHRRFFQEAREGLGRFSERLREEAAQAEDASLDLAQEKLARALLHAQRGLN